MMKNLLFTTFLLCFCVNFASAQNDYYKLKLKGGSEVFGQLLTKNQRQYRILTNNSDTIDISKRIIRRSYLIPGRIGSGDVVPIFQKGLFWGVQGSFGYGAIRHFDQLYLTQLNVLIAYQFKPNFSLGFGLKNSFSRLEAHRNYYRNYFYVQPYLQTRLNYRKKNWERVGLWFVGNGIFYDDYFIPTIEISSGISIFRPKRSWLFGVGYLYLGDGSYAISAQFGVQF